MDKQSPRDWYCLLSLIMYDRTLITLSQDWKSEKPTTPFTHVPVLTEFQEDGSKVSVISYS
jgi:hypothetical protein